VFIFHYFFYRHCEHSEDKIFIIAAIMVANVLILLAALTASFGESAVEKIFLRRTITSSRTPQEEDSACFSTRLCPSSSNSHEARMLG
jgi:hypothetical protein